MKREEAYEIFQEKEVNPLVTQYLTELEEKFQKNKEEYKKAIIPQFVDSFNKLTTLQQSGKLQEVSYIIATALRTSFYQKQYKLTIKAYNKYLYLNEEQEDIGECDITPIMEGYDNLYERLQKERKKYVGKLCATDIRNLLNQCLKIYTRYSLKLCKYATIELITSEEYKQINKADKLCILAEDYMDERIFMHIEDKDKNMKIIKENISEKEEEKLVCADYSNLDLSGIDFSKLNLSYSNFNNSIIDNANFNNTTLIGCTFYEAKIKNTNFQSAIIRETTFKKAEIKDTTFKEVIEYEETDTKDVGNLPIDFQETIMERVDFTNTSIHNHINQNKKD